eukprot:gene23312-24716_t
MRIALIIAVGLLATLLTGGQASAADWIDFSDGDFARFAYLGAILVALLASVTALYRGRIGTAMGHLAIWFGIFAAILVGYSNRTELKTVSYRALGVLIPGIALPDAAPGSVAVTKSRDGHFHVRATIDGRTVRLIVDTGASSVVLSNADARALGILLKPSEYTVTTSTANGRATAAPVVLSRVSIGEITLTDVAALVAQPGSLETSLLGNSFLDRLKSFTVEGDRLVLRR